VNLWGAGLALDDHLPEVVSERCVHARMAQATCRACVDACPRSAWVLDEERLGIDAARCDGCGLCAPACPEGAVLEHWRPLRLRVNGVKVAFAACAEAKVDGEGTFIPCLHILGVRRLLELQRDGVGRLVLARGDCDACPRGGVTRLDRALGEVNLLLRNRGLPLVDSTFLPSAAWSAELALARASHRPEGIGRRAFFRRALTAATERAADLPERDGEWVPCFVPPGRIVPRSGEGGLSLNAPRIDEAGCSGCDACVRLCPHEVIQLTPEGYRLDPDGCTGCGICVDACNRGAVRVERLAADPQTLVPLATRRCRACGADFHLPAARPASALCPVCAMTSHQRRLFQVLD